MAAQTQQSWEYLIDYTRFETATATTGGAELFGDGIPEDRVYYPFVLVLSDTTGASNTVDIEKVEEDGSTVPIMPNFNLDANETVVLDASELGVVLPRMAGGTDINFVAGSDSVEVTVFYFPNEV